MTPEIPASLRSDTDRWQLAVWLSDHGAQAWLMPRSNPLEGRRILLDASWEPDKEGLLNRIENVIYDHPSVLDDYTTAIVVESARTLMVPNARVADQTDAVSLYTRVFTSRDEDVIADETDPPETALLTLTPGMLPFLQRTFPGARVYSHLNRLKSVLREAGRGLRIYLLTRGRQADILAFSDTVLLSASTHDWHQWEDLAYMALNLADAYRLVPAEASILIHAPAPTATALSGFLADKFLHAEIFDAQGAPDDVPLSVSLPLLAGSDSGQNKMN